ncbi:unnamed protein product [Pleuronectes platessa]|uniref:Uncharacterized protein n=1 Tax=Pleuronectes platessa TaxID=8262 RepID=A0A9N7V398_PLEPL|nr:unnamed protein product [Pleuronectes platessa]
MLLEQRFSSLNSVVLKGVQACNPGSSTFLKEEDLRGLADHYNVDLKQEEVWVAKHYLDRKQESLPITDMQCLFGLLDNVMFPTLTQPEPVVKEAPQDVLARAKAKGILDRIGSNQPTSKEHRRNTGRTTKAVHAPTCQPLPLSVSVPSRNQETKGINRTALSGPQELTNRRQTSQVKPKALRLQTLKSTVSSPFSCSSQDGSSSSSCKPEDRTPPKSTNIAFSTTTSTLQPAPPPSAPVVRPRRYHQEVLKPVLFILPPVHFPNFVSHQTSRAGLRPSFSFNRWRTPAPILPLPRSNGGFSKDTMVKSPPLF